MTAETRRLLHLRRGANWPATLLEFLRPRSGYFITTGGIRCRCGATCATACCNGAPGAIPPKAK
jgi:hypothetical protein